MWNHKSVNSWKHGFLDEHSCLENWKSARDNGLPIGVIFVDFNKAFDKFPYWGFVKQAPYKSA